MPNFARKFEVLVTNSAIDPAALDILREKFKVTICSQIPTDREEVLQKCKNVDGILWASRDKLDAEVLDAAGVRLKAVSIMTSELDYVDVDEFKNRNIKLGHTPIVLNQATADIAIGLMIAAARRFHEGRQSIETSSKSLGHLNSLLGRDITGATIGFVGFGAIAQAVARRLRGFKIQKILYFNKGTCQNDENFGAFEVRFEDFLSQSDFVIIACPLTAETKKLFNENTFNKMKPHSVLVNISDGEIINQEHLFNALESGKIFSAGLDVTTPEPLPSDHPLLSLPNCVITPHLGSATNKTQRMMAVVAANNILNGLQKNRMITPAY